MQKKGKFPTYKQKLIGATTVYIWVFFWPKTGRNVASKQRGEEARHKLWWMRGVSVSATDIPVPGTFSWGLIRESRADRSGVSQGSMVLLWSALDGEVPQLEDDSTMDLVSVWHWTGPNWFQSQLPFRVSFLFVFYVLSLGFSWASSHWVVGPGWSERGNMGIVVLVLSGIILLVLTETDVLVLVQIILLVLSGIFMLC